MNGKCDHCGRTDTIKGYMSQGSLLKESLLIGSIALCHANPDGTKSDPDCYHLVATRKIELLGSRRRDINEAIREEWENQ